MLKDLMIELINKNDFQNKEKLKSLLLPTIGFKLNRGIAEITSSKVGGYPPIFENNWPLYQGEKMSFWGQISLSQISKINDLLPKDGILCFFVYTGDIGYRYPNKKGEFKVVYIENVDDMTSGNKFGSIKIIDERQISFFEYFTFPSYQESIIERENITNEELETIEEIESEILFRINENCETEHQLLGYPRALQGTVNFWWAVKYLGIEEKESYTEIEIKSIKSEVENFILLLQTNFGDSEIEIDYLGDSVAYFGIHKKDLQNRNFDNVILVMQNT